MASVRGRATGRAQALTRHAAALLILPGLLTAGVLAGAGSAAADDASDSPSGAAATLDTLEVFDQAVIHQDGEEITADAGLFGMSVRDGGTLQAYGIDPHNPAQERARYEEAPWAASPLHGNRDAGKINWILRHSYPQVDVLAKLSEVSGAGNLTPATAAAGTQVAIWRFSDDTEVTAVDRAAEKLADYLERAARSTPEPKGSLTLGPAAVSGKAGGRLGPVTVHTSAPSVSVAPSPDAASAGVDVVGADGRPVRSAKDGSKLYFDVPEGIEPGAASLIVQAATTVPVGRAFTATGDYGRSQALMVAGASQSSVSAAADVNWADGGAIPAVTAKKNCREGGVDITTANRGDKSFDFRLAGEAYGISPGETRTVAVPVREDQPYRISVSGPQDLEDVFTGVLDCATEGASSGGDGLAPQTGTGSATPGDSEAALGGDGPDGTEDGNHGEDEAEGADDEGITVTAVAGHQPGLAQTGGGSDTTLITGTAVGLLVAGGTVLLLIRKRGRAGAGR